MKFKDLGLTEETLKAIDECGYTEATPIQAQAIPIILMGRDLIGLAQTGTGKTAGFTLPMIEILANGRAKARMPRSLILTPTRELAAQVSENFDTYGKYHKLEMALLTGGTSMEPQIKKLERGVDVLIATPGRLLDLFERGRILLNDIKVLVIDEADRMLDMGFVPDIEKIITLLPPLRQTLFFSATMPPEIRKLSQKLLSNPKEISVAPPASTAENVKQFLVWTTPRDKKKVLAQIIEKENVETAFIFCNRKRDIGALAATLKKTKYSVAELHGDMAQKNRTDTLNAFKNGEVQLLVCSDVAGRGIDVDSISHVFNFDVPSNPDDYVHRIGRTGRAGQDGRAWTLAVGHDEKGVDGIEKRINKKIEVVEIGSGSGAGNKGKASGERKSPPNKRAERPASAEKPNRSKQAGSKDRSDHKPERQAQRRPEKVGQGHVKGFGEDMPDFF
jgi:superfamily II DNA/RNA helicase